MSNSRKKAYKGKYSHIYYRPKVSPEVARQRAEDKVKRREQFVARRERIEELQRKPEEW